MWSLAEIANLPQVRRVTVPVMTSALIFGIMPGTVSVALAQDASAQKSEQASSGDDSEVASKALGAIREANDLYGEEKYPEAFEKYQEAYDLYPDPAILVRLGKTAEKLERADEALEFFKEFVRLLPDDPAAEEVNEAIARLEQGDSVEVTLVSEPEGAVVFLGSEEGEILGSTPTTVQLPPGEHVLVFNLTGYESEEQTVEVVAGEAGEVRAELRAAGESVAELESPPPVEPEAEASHLDIYGWTLAGVGVATLVTSGVFYGIALSGEDDVNNYDKRAPGASRADLQKMKDDVETNYDVTLVTAIIGGVLTAAGAGLLTYHYLNVDEDDSYSDSWQWGVGADHDAAWVGVNGRF